MNAIPVLSILTFLPLIGLIVVLSVPKSKELYYKYIALSVTIVQVCASLFVIMFTSTSTESYSTDAFSFVEKFRWIEFIGSSIVGNISIDYFLGVDGISATMVLLSTIILCIATVASWNIKKSLKAYFALLLLLNTGIMGVFVSLDLFLFYIFWELTLLPMYFLIGMWGGERREYAAIKFFLYTLLGSVLILAVLIGLYLSSSIPTDGGTTLHTFNMLELSNISNYNGYGILSPFNPDNIRFLAFLGLFIGFAIKVPMFPFHTWLPDAHVEAPTPISVILAGILLKFGAYGMIRILFPLFPEITIMSAWWIALFGMINIIYGAIVALAQKDFKSIIAYSSISHMGYVLLGLAALNSIGVSGAVLQMFNHGTITAMLFLIVGIIYERTGTRNIESFGGISISMPRYFGVSLVAFFAAIGLPGLNSFISEFLVFMGGFSSDTITTLTAIALLGIVLGAVLFLRTIQKVFLGKTQTEYEHLNDLNIREMIMLIPLALIIITLGVYPSLLLDIFSGQVHSIIQILEESFFTLMG